MLFGNADTLSQWVTIITFLVVSRGRLSAAPRLSEWRWPQRRRWCSCRRSWRLPGRRWLAVRPSAAAPRGSSAGRYTESPPHCRGPNTDHTYISNVGSKKYCVNSPNCRCKFDMNLIYTVFLTTQLNGFSCISAYSSFLFCKCQQNVKKHPSQYPKSNSRVFTQLKT